MDKEKSSQNKSKQGIGELKALLEESKQLKNRFAHLSPKQEKETPSQEGIKEKILKEVKRLEGTHLKDKISSLKSSQEEDPKFSNIQAENGTAKLFYGKGTSFEADPHDDTKDISNQDFQKLRDEFIDPTEITLDIQNEESYDSKVMTVEDSEITLHDSETPRRVFDDSSSEITLTDPDLTETENRGFINSPYLNETQERVEKDSTEIKGTTKKEFTLQDTDTLVKPETEKYVPNPSRKYMIGDIINKRYEIEAILGKGGMGIVYKVKHLSMIPATYFALKILHSNKLIKGQFIKRFQREVSAMMKFVHPNVVQIREFGLSQDNKPYFTMDYYNGVSLKETLADLKYLDLNFALKIAMQILDALKSAHAEKIIHRDLKPDNILVVYSGQEPKAKVLDFGIAKNLEDEGTEKLTTGIVGTLFYMAPEQIKGEAIGAYTDIYSMGATLYHLITGEPPFVGSSQEILFKHIQEKPIPPSQKKYEIPNFIDAIVLKALAKKPEDRYKNAQEFYDDIKKAIYEIDKRKLKKNEILHTTAEMEFQQYLPKGTIINDKYKILENIGEGGMGVVYKVEHLELSKYFALKLLHSTYSQDQNFKDRFVREVEVAMEFTHENVVQIRDFGHINSDSYYFTMDFSSGIPLSKVIENVKQLDISKALDITLQILSALKTPHQKNIAHRDLKPDNILIEQRGNKDHALVLDFGIAKILDNPKTRQLTQESVIGTPAYMSPEQAGGDPNLDTRTDYYSIGVILYEMLTGRVPFEGSAKDMVIAHMVKDPEPPSSIRDDIPLAVESIISKAMSKERSERYDSAESFIADILNIEREEQRLQKKRKRKNAIRAVITCVFLLCILMIGAGYYLLEQKNNELMEQFTIAIINRNDKKAKWYLDEFKNMYFQINKKIYPKKVDMLSFLLYAELLLQKKELKRFPSLLNRLKSLKVKQDIIAHLKKQYERITACQKLLNEGLKALNSKQLKIAKRVFSEITKQKDTPEIQYMLKLIKNHELLLEKLQIKDYTTAEIILKKGNSLLGKIHSRWDIETFKNNRVKLAKEIQKYIQLEQLKPKIKQDITNLKRMIQEKKLIEAGNLLYKIQRYPQEILDRKKLLIFKQQYQEEKDYQLIKGLEYNKQEKALYEFLKKYPQTHYSQEIGNKLKKYSSSHLEIRLKSILKNYKKIQKKETRKELEVFFQNKNYKIVRRKVLYQGMYLLGYLYYQDNMFKKSILWFKKIVSYKYSKIYIAIAYYNLEKYKTAKKYIKRAGAIRKMPKSLEKDFLTTKILLHEKLYPKKKSKRIQLMKKMIRKYPKYTFYNKKIGFLYLSLKQKQKAKLYLRRYIEKVPNISKERKTLDIFLSLQNFYPLGKGYFWKYKVSNLIGGKISHIDLQIISDKEGKYIRRDNTNFRETLFIQGNYIINNKRKLLPVTLSSNSKWERPGFKVKIVHYNKKVKVETSDDKIKVYQCLVLLLTSWNNPYLKIKEYYADGIGEVKMERFLKEKKVFQKELVDYRTK